MPARCDICVTTGFPGTYRLCHEAVMEGREHPPNKPPTKPVDSSPTAHSTSLRSSPQGQDHSKGLRLVERPAAAFVVSLPKKCFAVVETSPSRPGNAPLMGNTPPELQAAL